MNRMIPITLTALLMQFSPVRAAVEQGVSAAAAAQPPLLNVGVDRVVVDTAGLARASAQMAESIERLALSIERLATEGEALDEEQRAMLMSAVKSVDEANAALSQLAQRIPQAADALSQGLPRAIRDSGQPIADLSRSLQSARDSVQLISESLPQATENAKSLANSVLDAALLRLSVYSAILIGLLALAVIAVMWFVYRQYLGPLARKLDEISGAPEQFAAIARHLENTSENLLRLER